MSLPHKRFLQELPICRNQIIHIIILKVATARIFANRAPSWIYVYNIYIYMTFTVTLSKRAISFGWLPFLGIKRTPPPPAHPWWKDSTQRWKGCWWLMVLNKFHRRFGNPNSTRWYPCNKHLQPSTLIGSLNCKSVFENYMTGLDQISRSSCSGSMCHCNNSGAKDIFRAGTGHRKPAHF